uniref:Uncharacterized protein n=1 Tax=Catharus ustulatus TaxID=91951 RepID=A0A8C3U490_CATUS
IMSDVRIRAHLWPFLCRGIINCFVIKLINHSWRVESRLVTHRFPREGSKRAGNVSEMRIRGMPRRDGLENWSKKLSVGRRVGSGLGGGLMWGLCTNRMSGL